MVKRWNQLKTYQVFMVGFMIGIGIQIGILIIAWAYMAAEGPGVLFILGLMGSVAWSAIEPANPCQGHYLHPHEDPDV